MTAQVRNETPVKLITGVVRVVAACILLVFQSEDLP